MSDVDDAFTQMIDGMRATMFPPHPERSDGDWWVEIRMFAGLGKVPALWDRLRPFYLSVAADDEIKDALGERPSEREDTRVMDLTIRLKAASAPEAFLLGTAMLLGAVGEPAPSIEAFVVQPRPADGSVPTKGLPLTPYQQRLAAGAYSRPEEAPDA